MSWTMVKQRLQELFGDDPLDRWRMLPPRVGPPRGTPRPRPCQRVPLLQFERLTTDEHALVSALGAGFEARVRPLGTDLDGDHALCVVSPAASFVLVGFGAHYNMTALASDYTTCMDGEAFGVRVSGERFGLEYVRLQGFAGHTRTPIGDVLLCILGHDNVAVVLVDDYGPRCVACGTVSATNGVELLPDAVPAALIQRPRPFTPTRVAEAIARQPRLHPAIRRHLTELVRAACDELGTECARHLVWALVTARARGRSVPVIGTHKEVYQWVLEQGDMRSPPKERASRGALHWLAARSPLFERTTVRRVAVWLNHLEWFTDPSPACLTAITRTAQTPTGGEQ